tara:strand:+ start:66 stop:305 length:240 start_codon:yes stop_codon:yes gene_type:complete
MTTLYKPEEINNAIKVLLLENINEPMYEFIRDLYFKLKEEYDFSSEIETSTEEEEEEEDDLIMEEISVVKSKDGFYSLT